jgi:hypothetical protein
VGTIVEVYRKSKAATNKYGLATVAKKKNGASAGDDSDSSKSKNSDSSKSQTHNDSNDKRSHTADEGLERYSGLVTRVTRRTVSMVLNQDDGAEFDLESPIVMQLVSDVVTFERMARALRRLSSPNREPSVICDAATAVLFRNAPGRRDNGPAEFQLSTRFRGLDFEALGNRSGSGAGDGGGDGGGGGGLVGREINTELVSATAGAEQHQQCMCFQNRWFNPNLNQEQREAVAMCVVSVAFSFFVFQQ